MRNLEDAARLLKDFSNGGLLGSRISDIEWNLSRISREEVESFLSSEGIDEPVLGAALTIKALAGQVNVAVHALGIALSLPHILDPGEKIEYVSLGAGNTGREFDLETDKRVAEYKFINWQGGPEAIRQNQIFKDLYCLAEAEVDKRRQLFVLGSDYPLKFFRGNRALQSVLSRNHRFRVEFYRRYPDQYKVVSHYYSDVKDRVEIVDLTQIVPAFRRMPPEIDEESREVAV